MNPRKLETLASLFDQDLAGWQITHCHFLELDHTLMGTFPAIKKGDREPIMALDKAVLQKVWGRLEHRPAKVTSIRVIAHPVSGVAFNLESYCQGNTHPIRILSTEEIDALCEKEDAMCWAPGLFQVSTATPVRDPVFA
jgi:hypothetical protein